MSQLRQATLLLAALLSLAAPPAHAQLVSDGTTNTLDNVTNVVAGDVTVGTNGSFTGLLLTNSACLTNTGNSYVGLDTGADSNAVFLHGTNTGWHMGGHLFVGSNGSFNTLLIADGATVANNDGYIGYDSGAHNNQVTVTGAGSLWSNRHDLYVGAYGGSNMLLIANGGRVASSNGYVGFGSNANDNVAMVTGTGSLWANIRNLYVGSNGAGNQLVVSNGGTVRSIGGYLGFALTSSNNVALVTGTGSLWTNSSSFFVGYSGSGNRVVVSNGGTLATYSGVTGPFHYVGYDTNANNNAVVVTGAGSLWTNTLNLYVGYFGSGNQLMVSDGATFATSGGDNQLGYSSISSNNVAVVTGAGSLWTNRSGLSVGESGSGNRLVVSDGGRLLTGNFYSGNVLQEPAYIGNNSTASDNVAIVTGAGSLWAHTARIYVGENGSGNQLVVSNGGTVRNTNATIGYSRSNNMVVVTGAGSLWTNSGSLSVGYYGSGNQLVVSDGGSVFNTFSSLGGSSSISNNNMAVVTGAGSRWHNAGDLNIGVGNQLLVSNGATVRSVEAYIGRNNLLMVTGAGSLWTNLGWFTVGDGSSGNRLEVSDGGTVWTGSSYNWPTYIGSGSNANNNVAVVTGAGSLLRTGDLRVGTGGNGNQLVVSNGGTVISPTTYLGTDSNANNNVVVVTGTSSLWTNSSDLYVGGVGWSNRLVVSNGGTVRNITGSIGMYTGNHNTAIVTGAGSLWYNRRGLYVGSNGVGNQLVVSDGGLVQASNAFVGFTTNATNNHLRLANGTVTVSGSLTIRSNNTLAGTGTINGLVTNAGTINVGNSAGSLRINGSLSLAATAGMVFEIGGLIATNQYDVVTVTNFVEFAGTLWLSLLPGFLPEAADSFALMSFASSSGGFANVSTGRVSLTNNLASFAVTLGATNLVLSAVQYMDSDGDGQGDLQEQAAGTDAADPASALAILSLTLNGAGHSVVRFQSVPGQSYRVEYSDTFTTWSAATGAVFTTPLPGVSQWVDDGTLTGGLPAAGRAYRIGLQ